MREVRQKELEQEKRVKGAQFARLQRSNEKESLEREVASKRRDFTHKYVRELIGAQRLELHLSQQLAHASTSLEEVRFQLVLMSKTLPIHDSCSHIQTHVHRPRLDATRVSASCERCAGAGQKTRHGTPA